jgi:transcriptional regulator with XRE-family HTH domain
MFSNKVAILSSVCIKQSMTKQTKREGTLLTGTRALLKASSSIEQVSVSTGISFHWLSKIANGHIRNPSVNRIQKVYEHLTGREINVK